MQEFGLEVFSSTPTQTLIESQCDFHSSIIYMFKPSIPPTYSYSNVLFPAQGLEGREPEMQSHDDYTAAEVAKNASIVSPKRGAALDLHQSLFYRVV